MKVLFVIDSLGHGGAERSLVEMIPALGAAGLETVIVTLDDRPGPLTQDARLAGASVVHLSERGTLRRIFELRRILKCEHPTIVHTTLIVSDQIGRLAAFGTGTRVISSLLFGIGAADPLSLASAAALLALVALAAVYAPARRASGLDPVTALRQG